MSDDRREKAALLKLRIELRWIADRAGRLVYQGHRRDLAIAQAVNEQMWMEEYDSPGFRAFLRKAA